MKPSRDELVNNNKKFLPKGNLVPTKVFELHTDITSTQ